MVRAYLCLFNVGLGTGDRGRGDLSGKGTSSLEAGQFGQPA